MNKTVLYLENDRSATHGVHNLLIKKEKTENMYRISTKLWETRVEVWENEKCCGSTSRQTNVFTAANFHDCFY